jgi:hypothetical protein
MRYWFDGLNEKAFALEVPPPDGENIVEVDEETFKEIVADANRPLTAVEQEMWAADRAYMAEKKTLATEINLQLELQAATATTPLTEGKSRAETMDMEQLARVWRAMQDARDKLSSDYEAADREIKVQQEELSGVISAIMATMKVDTLKTSAGVLERKEETHAQAEDWGAIYRFIAEHDAWEMLQKRLTTRPVLKWGDDHAVKDERGNLIPTLPPGISLFRKFKINVKKPSGKVLPSYNEEGTD